MSKQMETIDQHLIKNVKSNDLELNFECAEALLKSDNSSILGQKNSTLEGFVRLYREANGGEKCSTDTYQLLQSNQKAADIADDWNVDMLQQFRKEYRVRILLRKLVEKLADGCLKVEIEQFKERIKSVEGEKLVALRSNFRQLTAHVHELFRQRPTSGNMQDFARHILRQYFSYDFSMGSTDHFLKFIEKYTKLSSSAPSLIEKRAEVGANIDRFLVEFFVEPCGFYLEQMRSVGEPLMTYISIKKWELDLMREEEFYRLVGEYYMCRKFTEDTKSIVDKLVDCKVGNRMWFGAVCQ